MGLDGELGVTSSHFKAQSVKSVKSVRFRNSCEEQGQVSLRFDDKMTYVE